MTLHHHQPPTQIQCEHYLSCYRPDFNQTLKAGSLDEQQQQQQHQQYQQQERMAFHRGCIPSD